MYSSETRRGAIAQGLHAGLVSRRSGSIVLSTPPSDAVHRWHRPLLPVAGINRGRSAEIDVNLRIFNRKMRGTTRSVAARICTMMGYPCGWASGKTERFAWVWLAAGDMRDM